MVYDKKLKEIKSNKFYDASMQEYADEYAAFVIECFEEAKETTSDAKLQIEQKLDLTEYVPEAYGTGDAVIVSDDVLQIVDLKYGKGVAVDCDNNRQMMLYALGALWDYDFLYDIQTVRMTIYQPRLDNISTFEMPVDDLREWAENELKPRAALAFAGKGDFVPGSHCRFCRVKARCKALADEQLKIAKYEFSDSVLLADEEVVDILKRADAFKNWVKAVETFALEEAVRGKKWPEFKLVEGRSNRTYLSQSEVIERLIEKGYDEKYLYEPPTLLGITALEKVITKKVFNSVLGDLIVKPTGKPTLVPETDKRPAIGGVEGARADFAEVMEDRMPF
jgi:hypothetical protein